MINVTNLISRDISARMFYVKSVVFIDALISGKSKLPKEPKVFIELFIQVAYSIFNLNDLLFVLLNEFLLSQICIGTEV